MSPAQRMTARRIAALISEMRGRGCSQQTVLFAVDREYPSLTYKEFLTAVLIHEITREKGARRDRALMPGRFQPRGAHDGKRS